MWTCSYPNSLASIITQVLINKTYLGLNQFYTIFNDNDEKKSECVGKALMIQVNRNENDGRDFN